MRISPVARQRRHTFFFLDQLRDFSPVFLDTEVDMTAVRRHRAAARADGHRYSVVSYLLHRLEELIDGRPLIYVMDEFWKILAGGGELKEFARNKQKTIRKQNGFGIFATQSPEDALGSDISAALIEQTATLILLPNPGAGREDYIEGLKLTEAEYQVVKNLDERSRSFLVKQGHVSTVCQLNLRGMQDALAVISASTDNIAVMQRVLHDEAGRLQVSQDALAPEQWLHRFQQERKGSRGMSMSDGDMDMAAEGHAGRPRGQGAAPQPAPAIKEEWR